MADLSNPPDFGARARRLRVQTLVRLRWLAIAGQIVSILVVRFGFGFDLPLAPCFAAIALSALINIALDVSFERSRQFDDGPAAALLAFDVAQLAALLCLTGGIENPFALLILAPVVISAVSLPRRFTAALFALAAGLMLALTLHHWPLPWTGGAPPHLPTLYGVGLWLGVVIGTGFVCIYAGRVAEEARLLSDALAATELALAREQHLSQLDGLAAAAAHELGTPLATIALVVKEMARAPDTPPHRDDLDLLAQQTARCRDILTRLRSLDDNPAFFQTARVDALLEEICAPHRRPGLDIVVTLDGDGPPPALPRSPGLLYGVGNMVENAVDFARSRVTAAAEWRAGGLRIAISDDGPGFAPEILRRFGLPYLAGRDEARRAKTDKGGLGLGLFIAKTLLERSGGRTAIANGRDGGARAMVAWPKTALARQQAHAAPNEGDVLDAPAQKPEKAAT